MEYKAFSVLIFSKSKIKFSRFAFIVLRIPGPTPATFKVTTGHALMIPVHVYNGTPSVSGKLLTPGSTTYITEPIWVSPSLDCLFVVETA